LQKKDDTANMTRFYLQLCFLPKPKNFMRTDVSTGSTTKRLLKKTNFTLSQCLDKLDNQTTAETRKYFTLTRTLAEKGRLLLLPKLRLKRDKPILETLQSQPQTKPKPRNKANQNHRQPKRKPKTLKLISATWQN
jgi:hypothetical protein